MATWQDGPEYAPLERPSEFALPPLPPLEVAPPFQQMAAYAPKERPVFTDPPVPVAPLATLVPPVADRRDPQQPFDVASSTMTSDSAWGAVHWGAPSGSPVGGPAAPAPQAALVTAGPPLTAGPAVTAGPPSPPYGSPWPPPDQPLIMPSAQAAPPPGGFPAPGTPQWFAPPPYGEAPVPPSRVDFRAVFDAATPGLLIVLLIGALIYVLSPVVVVGTIWLSRRVKVATAAVRRASLIAVGAVAFFALIGFVGALVNQTGFGDWWAFVGGWSLAICWALGITVLVLVYRGLKAAAGPRRSTWG